MPRVSDAALYLRRQEILDGARRCFAEYGYEGATVRRLEESTGKTRGAIFHHFKDKETLFLALAREDASRMAEVVATDGLVDVMRNILRSPESYEWLITRLEIVRLIRTDAQFRKQWRKHQSVLDEAIQSRLSHNAQTGRMRTDVEPEVLRVYLDTILDGFISQLALGVDSDKLEKMLDLVEESIRVS